MNKTIKLIAIVLIAVLAFIGVYYLYRSLSGRYAPDNLVTQDQKQDETDQKDETGTEGGRESQNDSQDNPQNDSPDDELSMAPDFSVLDADGNRIKLSEMQGKPVVLNFWASWCYYCKVEMPDFEEMYKKYGEEIHFMMVNLTDGIQETMDSAKKHISDNGYTFPVYFDTDSEAAIMAYGISGIPVTYFINSEGNLVAYASGMINMELIEKGIDMITE